MSGGWSWATLAPHLDSLPIPAKHGWSWKRNICQQQHKDFWILKWASPLKERDTLELLLAWDPLLYVTYRTSWRNGHLPSRSLHPLPEPNHAHAAYCAFTHGLASKLTYFLRTIPETSDILQPLKEAINLHFIPALTRRSCATTAKRDLFTLLTRLGGLGLTKPMETAAN